MFQICLNLQTGVYVFIDLLIIFKGKYINIYFLISNLILIIFVIRLTFIRLFDKTVIFNLEEDYLEQYVLIAVMNFGVKCWLIKMDRTIV